MKKYKGTYIIGIDHGYGIILTLNRIKEDFYYESLFIIKTTRRKRYLC